MNEAPSEGSDDEGYFKMLVTRGWGVHLESDFPIESNRGSVTDELRCDDELLLILSHRSGFSQFGLDPGIGP